jgi:hypothetical protein
MTKRYDSSEHVSQFNPLARPPKTESRPRLDGKPIPTVREPTLTEPYNRAVGGAMTLRQNFSGLLPNPTRPLSQSRILRQSSYRLSTVDIICVIRRTVGGCVGDCGASRTTVGDDDWSPALGLSEPSCELRTQQFKSL